MIGNVKNRNGVSGKQTFSDAPFFLRLCFSALCIVFLFLQSCATGPGTESAAGTNPAADKSAAEKTETKEFLFPAPSSTQWQNLIPPVYYLRCKNKRERVRYTLVRIHLADSAIEVDGIPQNCMEDGVTDAAYLWRTAAQKGFFAAVNATPFDYGPLFSGKLKLCGLYIRGGTELSSARSEYAALCFDRTKRAYIANSQTDDSVKQAYLAFGGFWTILENGKILPFKNIRNARTAVGIGEDGYTLYLLTVEKNLFSRGLSFEDCALILKNAGAVDAVQLDGGGSTALIFPDFPAYSVRAKRKTANALGIRYVKR